MGSDGRLLLLDLGLSLDGLRILVLLVLLAEKSTEDAGTLAAGHGAGLVLCLLGGLLFIGRGAGGGSGTGRDDNNRLSGSDGRLGLCELGRGVEALLRGGSGSAR
jgi:hypothetical protein